MPLSRPKTTRRDVLSLIAALPFALCTRPSAAAVSTLAFGELYSKFGVLGFEFSEKVKTLSGQDVSIRGFMAPPLRAEAAFFVLTEIPMSICPFCSTDADWPDNIVVVYLDEKQTFVQPSQAVEAQGVLEFGSWTDPETGFVSLLRLRAAQYAAV